MNRTRDRAGWTAWVLARVLALGLLLGAAPAPVQQVSTGAALAVLGRPVQGPAGKEIGRIVDVLVDQDGQPVAAVIDFGGFFGVGSRKIAVDWKVLKFAPGNKDSPITLAMEPDQLKAAPEYKDQKTAPVVTPPSSSE